MLGKREERVTACSCLEEEDTIGSRVEQILYYRDRYTVRGRLLFKAAAMGGTRDTNGDTARMQVRGEWTEAR